MLFSCVCFLFVVVFVFFFLYPRRAPSEFFGGGLGHSWLASRRSWSLVPQFSRSSWFLIASWTTCVRIGSLRGAPGSPRRRFRGVPSLDFRLVFRSFFRSTLPSIFRCIFDVVCSPCRVDRGSAKRRRTLILCALSRFFKVFSTSRILGGAHPNLVRG